MPGYFSPQLRRRLAPLLLVVGARSFGKIAHEEAPTDQLVRYSLSPAQQSTAQAVRITYTADGDVLTGLEQRFPTGALPRVHPPALPQTWTLQGLNGSNWHEMGGSPGWSGPSKYRAKPRLASPWRGHSDGSCRGRNSESSHPARPRRPRGGRAIALRPGRPDRPAAWSRAGDRRRRVPNLARVPRTTWCSRTTR